MEEPFAQHAWQAIACLRHDALKKILCVCGPGSGSEQHVFAMRQTIVRNLIGFGPVPERVRVCLHVHGPTAVSSASADTA